MRRQVLVYPTEDPAHVILNGWTIMNSFLVHLRDPYLIALRSVTLPTHPPTEDYTRGEVLCAGFTILEESSCITKVWPNETDIGWTHAS